MTLHSVYEFWINKVHQGHSMDVLRQMPSESVDCVVTSPPYFGLRKYDIPDIIWDGQKECDHEWGKLDLSGSGFLSQETKSITLINMSCQINAITNIQMDNERPRGLIEVGSHS